MSLELAQSIVWLSGGKSADSPPVVAGFITDAHNDPGPSVPDYEPSDEACLQGDNTSSAGLSALVAAVVVAAFASA